MSDAEWIDDFLGHVAPDPDPPKPAATPTFNQAPQNLASENLLTKAQSQGRQTQLTDFFKKSGQPKKATTATIEPFESNRAYQSTPEGYTGNTSNAVDNNSPQFQWEDYNLDMDMGMDFDVDMAMRLDPFQNGAFQSPEMAFGGLNYAAAASNQLPMPLDTFQGLSPTVLAASNSQPDYNTNSYMPVVDAKPLHLGSTVHRDMHASASYSNTTDNRLPPHDAPVVTDALIEQLKTQGFEIRKMSDAATTLNPLTTPQADPPVPHGLGTGAATATQSNSMPLGLRKHVDGPQHAPPGVVNRSRPFLGSPPCAPSSMPSQQRGGRQQYKLPSVYRDGSNLDGKLGICFVRNRHKLYQYQPGAKNNSERLPLFIAPLDHSSKLVLFTDEIRGRQNAIFTIDTALIEGCQYTTQDGDCRLRLRKSEGDLLLKTLKHQGVKDFLSLLERCNPAAKILRVPREELSRIFKEIAQFWDNLNLPQSSADNSSTNKHPRQDPVYQGSMQHQDKDTTLSKISTPTAEVLITRSHSHEENIARTSPGSLNHQESYSTSPTPNTMVQNKSQGRHSASGKSIQTSSRVTTTSSYSLDTTTSLKLLSITDTRGIVSEAAKHVINYSIRVERSCASGSPFVSLYETEPNGNGDYISLKDGNMRSHIIIGLNEPKDKDQDTVPVQMKFTINIESTLKHVNAPWPPYKLGDPRTSPFTPFSDAIKAWLNSNNGLPLKQKLGLTCCVVYSAQGPKQKMCPLSLYVPDDPTIPHQSTTLLLNTEIEIPDWPKSVQADTIARPKSKKQVSFGVGASTSTTGPTEFLDRGATKISSIDSPVQAAHQRPGKATGSAKPKNSVLAHQEVEANEGEDELPDRPTPFKIVNRVQRVHCQWEIWGGTGSPDIKVYRKDPKIAHQCELCKVNHDLSRDLIRHLKDIKKHPGQRFLVEFRRKPPGMRIYTQPLTPKHPQKFDTMGEEDEMDFDSEIPEPSPIKKRKSSIASPSADTQPVEKKTKLVGAKKENARPGDKERR